MLCGQGRVTCLEICALTLQDVRVSWLRPAFAGYLNSAEPKCFRQIGFALVLTLAYEIHRTLTLRQTNLPIYLGARTACICASHDVWLIQIAWFADARQLLDWVGPPGLRQRILVECEGTNTRQCDFLGHCEQRQDGSVRVIWVAFLKQVDVELTCPAAPTTPSIIQGFHA